MLMPNKKNLSRMSSNKFQLSINQKRNLKNIPKPLLKLIIKSHPLLKPNSMTLLIKRNMFTQQKLFIHQPL